MPARHAAAQATRAVAAKTAEKKPYDVRFVRSFLRAAIHGHSPHWKRLGWKASNVKHGKHRPLDYLSKDLVERDLSRNHAKGGHRIGEAPQDFKQFYTDPEAVKRRREAQLQARNARTQQTRGYVTRASDFVVEDLSGQQEGQGSPEAEEEESQADLMNSDASTRKARDGMPSVSSVQSRKLKPGDWVQARIFGISAGYIYLTDDMSIATASKRAVLHGLGNQLHSIRHEDLFFRIPEVVPPAVAKQAARMLKLSPPEYLENLEEMDNRKFAASELLTNDSSNELDPEAEEMWKKYGMEFGSEGWQAAFEAKLRIGYILRQINVQQESVRKEILIKGIRGLYEKAINRKRPTEYMTTREAYEQLYGKDAQAFDPEEEQQRLLAIHNHLLNDPEHYVADAVEFMSTSRFRLRPKVELQNLVRVREWVRKNSKEITHFKWRTRQLRSSVQDARRKQAGTSGMSSQLELLDLPDLEKWSSSDLAIIEFLKYSLDMKRKIQINPFEAYAAVLVKDLSQSANGDQIADSGLPSFHFTRMATIQLLKDIGVYTDWENMVVRDRDLGIEEWTEQLQRPLPKVMEEQDGLDSVRHDFGSLPVYTIDDASASELDDGISIEKCADKLDSLKRPTYWVHVHIADPTACLQPNDELALQAKKRLSTIYFPEMTWPMMRFDVIEQQGWSLGSATAKRMGKGQKVLTFSVRLDDDGNMLEQTIRAGVVHDIRIVTYDMVDEVLGYSGAKSDKKYAGVLQWPTSPGTGDIQSSPHRSSSELPETGKEDLETLFRLSEKVRAARTRISALAWESNNSRVHLHPRPILPVFETPAFPRLFANQPQLSLHLPTFERGTQISSAAQSIVSEFMILAGRTAGFHLADRGLAAPFRGQQAPLESKPGQMQRLLEKRDLGTGLLDYTDVIKTGLIFQPAHFATTPVGHWPMGIEASKGGYVRATSPLRRYSDMLVHWQIKSTLGKGDGKAPFSAKDVEEMIGQVERVTRARTRSERRATNFWKLLTIEAKFREVRADPSSDPEAAEVLLNGLTAVVGTQKIDLSMLRIVSACQIPELGVQATLQTDPKAVRLQQGQRVKVDITGIILDEFSKMYVHLK